MKKLILLLSILSVLVLAACSASAGMSDDERVMYAAAETTCFGFKALTENGIAGLQETGAQVEQAQLEILEKYGFNSMEEFEAAAQELQTRFVEDPEGAEAMAVEFQEVFQEVCPELAELQEGLALQ